MSEVKAEVKLIVRNLIGDVIDGMQRVSVSNELFNLVRGMTPALKYKAMGDQANTGVRVFEIDGKELYASYDKETRKTMFLMKEDEAKECLQTLAEQREGEDKLPFNTTSFDRSVVASA